MKKKSRTKSTETMAPSSYSQPFINDAASTLRPSFDQSMGLMQRYQPMIDEGIDYFGSVANSRGGNPFLDQIAERSRENTMDAVASRFSQAGRYGSGMFTDTAARAVADQENQLRYNDWYNQQNRADDAAMKRAALIENAVGMPQQIAGGYAGNVNNLLGRYVTSTGQSTTKSSPSLLSTLAKAAQAASMMGSDPRLKTNVEKLGEYPDGLGIYEWDYLPIEGRIADFMPEGRQIGVMANEVAELRPWALGPVIDGYATVNYGAL